MEPLLGGFFIVWFYARVDDANSATVLGNRVLFHVYHLVTCKRGTTASGQDERELKKNEILSL
jgi:hypothetical protein